MSDALPLVVIKLGGTITTNDRVESLAIELAALCTRYRFILVHGGGNEISLLSRQLGMVPRFVNGIRMTTAQEMEVVDMILAGSINKRITRVLRSRGINAMGIACCDGGLVIGEEINEGNHTGRIKSIDPQLIKVLLKGGYLPVINPTSMESGGGALNINADEVGVALASSYPADLLLLLSDVPGVYGNGLDGEIEPRVDSEWIESKIADGSISGGMIPKLEGGVRALNAGVKEVQIGGYATEGDLGRLIAGSVGTRLIPTQESAGRWLR